MSHEMRTPLNGVVGAAEMLAAGQLPPKERQLVDWLLTSSRQLRSLIDNLLDLRKIEAGKIVIERAPLDLHVLMNRLAVLFQPEAKRAHVRFTKSVSVDAPYTLMGDDLRIHQVLINLTRTRSSRIKVLFRVSATALAWIRSLGRAALRVRYGYRNRAEDAGQIFDRFTQANPVSIGSMADRDWGPRSASTWLNSWAAPSVLTARREGTTFWFTVHLLRQPVAAQEDDAGVQTRGTRLVYVSGRPGAGDWLANTARDRDMRYAAFSSIEGARNASPHVGSPVRWSSTQKTSIPTGATPETL
jgi:hypothetical protein